MDQIFTFLVLRLPFPFTIIAIGVIAPTIHIIVIVRVLCSPKGLRDHGISVLLCHGVRSAREDARARSQVVIAVSYAVDGALLVLLCAFRNIVHADLLQKCRQVH